MRFAHSTFPFDQGQLRPHPSLRDTGSEGPGNCSGTTGGSELGDLAETRALALRGDGLPSSRPHPHHLRTPRYKGGVPAAPRSSLRDCSPRYSLRSAPWNGWSKLGSDGAFRRGFVRREEEAWSSRYTAPSEASTRGSSCAASCGGGYAPT